MRLPSGLLYHLANSSVSNWFVESEEPVGRVILVCTELACGTVIEVLAGQAFISNATDVLDTESVRLSKC